MADTDYDYRFSGIRRLYGDKFYPTLKTSHIAVVGLGGVGSWCAEALTRSGIGSLTLVDFDDICVSNTNRQLHALRGNIGKLKTQAMSERLTNINPDLKIQFVEAAYSQKINDSFFSHYYDVIVDAIDDTAAKFDLILACKQQNIPLVVSGAAGGRQDPAQIQWADLSRTKEDKMLSLLRKRLRQKANFPRTGSMGIACVYSQEKPKFYQEGVGLMDQKPEGFKKPLDCASGFGTSTMVTGSFGFQLAHLALSKVDQP